MRIPGFVILDPLGESSMTEVWKAYQKSLKREVTLKILKDEFASQDSEVERFCAEAKQTATLSHERIVQIYNVSHHDGRPYLVMEHVPGPTLEDALRREGVLAPRAAMRVAGDVAEALHYAWAKHRMIHRNLTPRSILLDGDGRAHLAYVGLSMRVDLVRPDKLFRPGVVEGTPFYMSPEQASASPELDCRSDMYSLGATVYQMITGEIPFGGLGPLEAMRGHVEDTLPALTSFVEDLPDSISFVVEKLMMKAPENRFPDWADALRSIQRELGGSRVFVRKSNGGGSTLEAPSARKSKKTYRIPTRPKRGRSKVRIKPR